MADFVLMTLILAGTDRNARPGRHADRIRRRLRRRLPMERVRRGRRLRRRTTRIQQGPQVLTRGPIHEAFAAPVVHDPAAGPVIPKQPPDPIQEMPPGPEARRPERPVDSGLLELGRLAQRLSLGQRHLARAAAQQPVGARLLAPGRRGQPVGAGHVDSGELGPAQGQGQASAQAQAIVPAGTAGEPRDRPDHAAARAPTSPGLPATGPGKESVTSGGPGFWAAVQPNWIWMPAHYVWTPSGYLFVPGYWDLPVANRGLMFAPVYYPQPVYAQPGFVFTPSISIVGSAVTANLFVSAGTNQYLFGDFYAQNFVSVGITPWFSFSFATGPAALL